MKKSELIKIIKEEISNLLSEEEAAMSVDLRGMTKAEMKDLGAETLRTAIFAQCQIDGSGVYTTAACQLASEAYKDLNPTGSY